MGNITILKRKCTSDDELGVALVAIDKGTWTEHATWVFRHDEPNSYFWGHYYSNIRDAEHDFNIRDFGRW